MKVQEFDIDVLLDNPNNSPSHLSEEEKKVIRKKVDTVARRYIKGDSSQVIIPLSAFIKRLNENELIYAKSYADSKNIKIRTSLTNIDGVITRSSIYTPLYRREETKKLPNSIQRAIIFRLTDYKRKIEKGTITESELEEYKWLRAYFITHNIRLALTFARKHHSDLSYDEKDEIALELLIKAADSYIAALAKNEHTKIPFSTYVVNTIKWKWAVEENKEHLLRLSTVDYKDKIKLESLSRYLHSGELDELDLEILAEKTGMSKEEVTRLLTSLPTTESLEAHLESSGKTLDFYSPPRFFDQTEFMAEEHMTQESQIEDVTEALFNSELTEIERRVLHTLYGFDDDQEKSLREAGQKLGMSYEAVRQKKNKALEKVLKEPSMKKYSSHSL